MSEKNKQNQEISKENNSEENKPSGNIDNNKKTEKKSVEEKLKETEEKLLRSLAEIENQRRRFEKEIKDAFEFGSFNFAKESLAILDNLQRAKEAIKNDEKLKTNKDLDKFLENINIIEKDLVSIFEKNRIKKIDTNNKKFDPNFHQAMSEIEDDKERSWHYSSRDTIRLYAWRQIFKTFFSRCFKEKSSKDQENKDKKKEN